MVALCVIVNCVPAPEGPLLVRVENSRFLPEDSSTLSEHFPPKVFRSKVPVLEPKSLRMVHQQGSTRRPPMECDYTATDSYLGAVSHAPSEKIVRIEPIQEEVAELITVTIEYTDHEKKTTKTLTHPDGSQTITTTIEEIEDDATNCNDDEYTDEGSCSLAMDNEMLDDVALDEEVMRLTDNYRTERAASEEPPLHTNNSGAYSRQAESQYLYSNVNQQMATGEIRIETNAGQCFLQVNNSDDLD